MDHPPGLGYFHQLPGYFLQIDVFLKGEFPAGFRKLANTTREFLGLLKDRNSSRIRFRFISPLETVPGRTMKYGDSLVNMGAVPINLTVQRDESQSSNIIFPVAVISYKGRQSLVNLYPGKETGRCLFNRERRTSGCQDL